MNETLTKLGSYTVSASGGDTMVTFNNIPQGYSDLKIVGSVRSAGTGNTVLGGLINGSYSGYSHSAVYTQDSTNASSSQSTTFTVSTTPYARLSECYFDGGSQTAGMYTSFEWYMPGYSSSNYKSSTLEFCSESNSASAYVEQGAIFWQNSAAVTSLSFVLNNGNIAQYSSFTLYGVKNMANILGNSVRASGGTITTDGTYVYHTFNSTGAFQPSTRLLADVLVVAGGGGGAGSDASDGGGGAGGVIYFTSQPLTNGTSYACTVGSGGAVATNGVNSYFGSLTAAVGGGGGTGNDNNVGQSGGSGGGAGTGGSTTTNAGGSSTQTGTGAAAYYGNAGGSGTGSGSGSGRRYNGGGGGGAGTAGGNASGSNAGNGGDGTSAFSTLLYATNTGVNVNGTYYIAGGGGGWAGGESSHGTPGTGGLGGGGNGGINSSGPTVGAVNTGSGGGAGGFQSGSRYAGVAGGSGLIIVRYKM